MKLASQNFSHTMSIWPHLVCLGLILGNVISKTSKNGHLPTMCFLKKFLVVVLFILFFVKSYFGYVNNAKAAGIFYSSFSTIQAKYVQEVSAEPIIIRIVLFVTILWNFADVFYLLVSVFLPPNRSPVNVEPTLISNSLILGWIIGIIATIGYYFAFDRELLRVAFSMLVIANLGQIFTLLMSYKLVYDNLILLENPETQALLWMVRALLQNGLSIPTAALIYVMFINLANVVIYNDSFGLSVPTVRDNITIEDGSSMVLALVLVSVVIWFVMENFLVEVYCRYTFTVFPTLIVLLSGLVAKLRNIEGTRNYAFSIVLLTFCIFAAIFRVVLFFHRKKARIAAAAIL